MTISKGSTWGRPGLLPPGAPVAGSDAALGAIVETARRAGHDLPVVGLTGGSLWRTLGGPAAAGRLHGPDAWHYPIDVGAVLLDGRPHWFVASLVVRSRWWTPAFVVMNAQWVGEYQFGHRAHPGDALLDAYTATLPLGDVPKVAARARNGAHLPHPAIVERRAAEHRYEAPGGRALGVWIDGQRRGRTRSVHVQVEPDALTVVV